MQFWYLSLKYSFCDFKIWKDSSECFYDIKYQTIFHGPDTAFDQNNVPLHPIYWNELCSVK